MTEKRTKIHSRFPSESDVDGFRSEEAELEVYCGLDHCKFGFDTHAACTYFQSYIYSDDGEVIGIRCARPDEDDPEAGQQPAGTEDS